MLTHPHWQGYGGGTKTGGRADIGRLDPPLTKESALGTQPPSQSAHLSNTGAGTVEQDTFIGGKTWVELRPEDDLSGYLLVDAANGFKNLLRLAML